MSHTSVKRNILYTPMAIGKKIRLRRCPIDGSIVSSTTVFSFEGHEINQIELYRLLESVVIKLSPNGEDLSIKKFKELSFSLLTEKMGFEFKKNEENDVKRFLKYTLQHILREMERKNI